MKIWEKIKEIFKKDKPKAIASKFIIEAVPKTHQLTDIELIKSQTKLEDVQKVNEEANKMVAGISLQDAEVLLKYIVNNTRTSLKRESYYPSVEEDDFCGECGYAQAISSYQFQKLGIDNIAANVSDTCYSKLRHAHLIAKIPIENEGKVDIAEYLIDTTYRQFFIVQECSYERFLNPDNYVGPDPGYFVCKNEEGKEFAKKLIEDGYIRLTKENAKIYGDGFCLASRNKDFYKNQKPPKGRIKTEYTGNDYLQELLNQSEMLDYTKEELELCGDIYPSPKEKINGTKKEEINPIIHDDNQRQIEEGERE